MYFKYVAVLYFSYLDTCSIRLLLLLLILPLLELTHHFVLQSDVLLGVFQGCMLRGTAGGSNAWSISLGCLCCRYHVCSGFGTRTPSTRNIPADISDHAPCTGSVLAISTVNIILPSTRNRQKLQILEVYSEYEVYWEHLCMVVIRRCFPPYITALSHATGYRTSDQNCSASYRRRIFGLRNQQRRRGAA